MPAMLTDEDLSLRHLPEVSDYSFSFQIPASTLPRGDDLMADDNTFLEGANAQSVLATPAPPPPFMTRCHPRVFPEFTQRPSSLEPSPPPQQPRISPPSESPSTSYGRPGLRPSPIIEAPKLSNDLGISEEEDLNKESTKHEYQDPEERQEHGDRKSTSRASSPTLNGVLSPAPAFAERSSLGSWPEAGYSGTGLPQTETRPPADSRVVEEGQQVAANSNNIRSIHPNSGSKSSTPVVKPRSARVSEPTRQSTVTGGISKSRRLKKPARAKNERLQVGSSIPIITSCAVRRQLIQPEKPICSSADDKPPGPNHSLSSFASSGVSAGRLVMSSKQFTNTRSDAAESLTFQRTEPNYPLDQILRQEGHEKQDTYMNPDDRQDDPSTANDIHTNKSGDRDDDRDKPLTLLQLSSCEPSILPITTVEREDDGTSSLRPPSPVTQAMSVVPRRKKRNAPTTSGRGNERARKRSRGEANAVSVQAPSGFTKLVPAHAIASTSTGHLSVLTSAVSSVLTEMQSSSNDMSFDASKVIEKIEGGREENHEENVADAAHAKSTASSDPISTSGCGRPAVGSDSGQPIHTQQVVKKPLEIRTRNQSRIISASVKGRGSSRSRSISKSAATHADVLRASERGRRLAQIRKRREAHGKENSHPMRLRKDGGDAREPKPSDETYFMKPMRPVKSKPVSDLRVRGCNGDSERMSRSASSLSSSGGEINNASVRAHHVSDFKTIRAHEEASQLHRKENIHPVIPQPFLWATDQRIKERKQFDEMIKEKARERAVLEEQKQRERAEEEEREIRELRKRAIPKANVVPDWYKDAPKRTREGETIDHGSG